MIDSCDQYNEQIADYFDYYNTYNQNKKEIVNNLDV